MTEPLEPLPDDVVRALGAERDRPAPPEAAQSGAMAVIEASDQFQIATGLMQVRPDPTPSWRVALRTRTGLVLFLAGTLWGLVLGAAAVALVRLPASQAAPDAGAIASPP